MRFVIIFNKVLCMYVYIYIYIFIRQMAAITNMYGRWWVGCYIWYSEEGPGRAATPPSPFLAVPNVTAHPSMASVYTNFILFDVAL